jgi:hypothetical protein
MIRHDPENPELPVPDDSILREMYVKHNMPCDRLVNRANGRLLSCSGIATNMGG